MTCSKNEFAMSDEGTIQEKRINLGNVDFDSNVNRLGDKDIIYTIKEERTAFFRFSFNYDLVEQEKNSDCKIISKDMFKPQKGDVYLLIRAINPQDGKSFVMQRKL
jgi:hypothetical protein